MRAHRQLPRQRRRRELLRHVQKRVVPPLPPPHATRAETRAASVGYIEGYYNRRRPHTSIGNAAPADKMGAFMARMDAIAKLEEGMPIAA